LKTAYSLNQEYDRIKTEISRENLKIQEIKAKNDEVNQMQEGKIADIMKSKSELEGNKEKMKKLKEEKSFLLLKVLRFLIGFLMVFFQRIKNHKKKKTVI